MPSTYTPISSTTLGSAQSTVTLSGISGVYTDLILVSNIIRTATTQIDIRLNSDTGTNYSYTILQGNGTSASSSRVSNATAAGFDYGTTSPSTNITQFQNYSNTTTFKTFLCSSSEAAVWRGQYVNLWRSTSAITSITIIPQSGNINTGSTFTLYGIKAA